MSEPYFVNNEAGLLKTSYMDVEQFRATGLLWFINRSLFHPLGYALALAPDGKFQMWGNGDEPWHFELPDGEEDEAFRAVKKLFADLLHESTSD